MNLKQKTFLFVTVSIAALLAVYIGFSSYYLRTQERALNDERVSNARALAQEFSGFFQRGIDRLQTVAALPALVYGFESLEQGREGKQIPTWTTLHYLFYESDVFSSVYMVNGSGKILWTEPPDQDLIETKFQPFDEIMNKLESAPGEVGFLLSDGPSGLDILIASPLTAPEGRIAGLLVGVVPNSHASIKEILRRNGSGHGTAQLIDEASKRVIASTDEARETRPFEEPDPSESMVVKQRATPSPWVVVIDQNNEEAYSGMTSLKKLLAVFGALLILIAMGSLIFMLRSFTRPVEVLTASARTIADGDLSGGFTLDRSDEIGVLSKTLDEMKMKLKSSYDLLLHSEKAALMGQVVAGIAHELNNPLTIVIGNIQLMMTREMNEKNVQSLTRIKDGAERASKIVKNLLAFARQEKPERKPTDINVVLRKALELRAYELKVSNIEVSTELTENLPETMADPHQLQQVFLNLIVNAEQAMIDAHGKGLLRISTRSETGKLLIFFSDDGPGIPRENLRRIFEPFFTTKSRGQGTGLGLATVYGIAKGAGGAVDVSSRPGEGTRVDVFLPAADGAPEAPGHVEQPPARGRGERILVVEDEDALRVMVRRMLAAHGYEVLDAQDAEQGLRVAELHKLDLLLTDVGLPRTNGAILAQRLVERQPSLRVLYMTGYPPGSEPALSSAAPLIQKPFSPLALLGEVRRVLDA